MPRKAASGAKSSPGVKAAKDATEAESGILAELYGRLFGKDWEMWVGAILLAILSCSLFLIQSPWAVSSGILNAGMNLYGLFGVAFDRARPDGVPGLLHYRYTLLGAFTLLGAMGAALLSRNFAIRIEAPGDMAKAFIGGVLMAAGFVLGVGCTIGAFFSGIAALSGGAIIFGIGLAAGTYAGVRYKVWEIGRFPGLSAGRSLKFLANSEGSRWQPIAGWLVILLALLLAAGHRLTYHDPALTGFCLIGILIGVVIQRSRFCIVKGLREPFETCDPKPTEALIIGLAVALFGFSIIKWTGAGNEMYMVEPVFFLPAIIGGFIFGFGMNIAGGCTVGSIWRSGEGRTKFWLALFAMVGASPLFAEYLNPGLMDALPSWARQEVFLPDHFTYPGSMAIMAIILLLWFMAVQWNGRSGKLSVFK